MACNNAPLARDVPQEAASTASTTAPTIAPSSSGSVVGAIDAGSASSSNSDDDAAPPTPKLATDKWATVATTKKTIAAKYPADVFPKTKVAADSLTLTSKLERGLLGEGNGNQKHRFQITIDFVAGTPFESVRRDFKAYPFPQMFPKGTEDSYVELADDGCRRLVLGGKGGYRVHTGVEGYNENTSFVEASAKKSLRFRCTYVGSVMGPEIDEDTQVAICDAVLDSVIAALP